MGLRSFYIKPVYHSQIDNPYSEFFIPSLSNAVSYWRYGGFFSSKNLAICAEGIQEFLKNNGKIRLILSPNFSQEDAKAIKEGILTPEKFLNDVWMDDIDQIKEEIQKDHLRALSWLIAQTPPRLEIKIAIFRDTDSNPLDGETIEKFGISQQSFGLFHDEEGNAISFKGMIKSMNQNDTFYDFNVFKSWIDGQKEYVEQDYLRFIEYWDATDTLQNDHKEKNPPIAVDIIDLPSAIREKFLEISPKDIGELKLLKLPKLKPYQNEAVNSWFSHGRRGIFQMATGTGKTFCAIACIKELESLLDKLFVVVVCPTTNLVHQWREELTKWGYGSKNTLIGKEKWLTELRRYTNDFNYDVKLKQSVGIIITTYATFSKKEFTDLIKNVRTNTLIIADEVHASGSEQGETGLIDEYNFRLGLSATPFRYFDDIGTNKIFDYFKPITSCSQCNTHNSIVFSFELKDAIPKYLVEYDYFPYYVELTDDEINEYRIKTQKIAQRIAQAKDKVEENELLSLLVFERANIIKNAENKVIKFKEIIEKNPKIDYCIVYCAPSKGNKTKDQISQVQDILNKFSITNYRIKSDEMSLQERIDVLEQLEGGLIKVVESIQILDEGVDIPPLKNAILLASTGNPKQFIQRRGRVLRKWDGFYSDGTSKTHATIHDVFVIPYLTRPIDPAYMKIEKEIIKKELTRHEEMAKISRNPEFGIEKIKEIKKKFDLI